MDRQAEIVNLCRDLSSEKGAERRKAAVKLNNCLNQSSVKKTLDKNYEIKQLEGKKSRVFTWENVFRAMCIYVQLETDELQKANENVSKSTKTLRETRKKDVSGLVKAVVRAADKGSPKLKGTLLFEHIKGVLMDPVSCAFYGQDYCSLLLKNVLTVKSYVVELNSKELHEMVFLFSKLFNSADVSVDRLVLARIIHSLVHHLTVQCDVRSKKILTFFIEFFSKSKQHKSGLIVQHLVSALNILVRDIAPTSRGQVCCLGEEILLHMLHLWHNIAAEELKDCLLEFMKMQMWCHHPRGDRQGVGGAYARDWDKWMSHLRKLYDLMYTEIHQLLMKTRVKDIVLKPAFVSLAVDLCQQLFTEGSNAIEVTQLSIMDEDSAQPGPGPKRRRRETGWQAVRTFISDAGQSERMVPWLQLVKGFIDKYPDKFPAEEVVPYLTCLSQVVAGCKQADLMAHLQKCVAAFAANWDRISLSMSDGAREQSRSAWNQLWMATLRFVSLHHGEGQGYMLLSAMMSHSLITPRREIWSLFVPSVTQPITQSVQFLWQQLTSSDIPEKFVPSLVVPATDVTGDTKYPLRMQLLDWLLPSLEDAGESSRSHRLNPDWTAKTLMTLTLNDPSSAKIECETEQDFTSSLEKQFLEICLELPLTCFITDGVILKTGLKSSPVHVPVLLLAVENVIKRDVQYLCSRSDEQVSQVQEMLTYCQMVANFLSHLLTNKILTPDTVLDSNMYTCLSVLLKKISSTMCDIVKKDGVPCVASLVESLKCLFNWRDCSLQVGGVMSCLCRAASPSQLTDLLMDIAIDKLSKKDINQSQSELGFGLNESRTIHERSRSRIMEFDDNEFDLDLEKEASGSHGNNNMEIDDLDFEEKLESQDSEDNLHSMEICQSLLTSPLSESQTLRLQAVSALCEWCSRGAALPWKLKLEVDLKVLKSKVVHLLSNEAFDTKKAFDLQMMMMIVTSLTEPNESLTTKELLTFATAVRSCVSGHWKDTEVCAACISLLSRLVPHIAVQEAVSSGSLRETQFIILHLADAFWKLETYSSPVRRQLTILMERLMENDPQCIWSRFKSEKDDVSPDSQDATGPSPAERFINSISDDCLLVRMKVSSAIYRLFLQTKDSYQEPFDRATQERMFALLFKELTELVELAAANLSAERREDFCSTVDSTLLRSLGAVMCHSNVCEKIALFSLLQFVQQNSLHVNKVCKLLSNLSSIHGYGTVEQYVASHLPYLVHKWLVAEYPVKKFPFQILNCTSLKQFYGEYHSVLIPELVACKALQDVQNLAATLGQPHTDLLKLHIPRTMTHILPAFASGKLSTKATAAYDLLVQELTKTVVEAEIVNNLDEIVVNLLLCLHETEHDVGAIRDTNPEPNSPFYSGTIASATLDYLTRSFSGTDSSLVEILSKTADSLQKILLKLSSALCNSRRMSDKRSMLFKYRLFTRLLLKHFHTQLGGSWAFVLRDVLTRLVYLVTDMCDRDIGKDIDSCYRESVACVALELLREVCQTAIDTCAKEFIKYMGFLTSNLISIAELPGDIGQQALAILKLMIIERGGDLRTGVAALDNFPDRPAFKECRHMHHKLKYAAGRFTLKQEVEHFLLAGSDHIIGSQLRLEGLHFLYEQLKENVDQLHTLTNDDTLLRLVCSLVELSKCGNQSVVQATSRCLGVLGPVDMKTICFPQPPRPRALDVALKCFEDMPTAHKYCYIFHRLNDYLTDKSIELVQCTSDVLKLLLGVKPGSVFSVSYKTKLGDLEFLFHYLHPFRGSKKRALHVTIPSANWERFQNSVDQESLWNPPHGNHGNWLVTMTTTLLESGAVRDEILVLLGPVCQIKSELCEMVLPYIIHDILENGSTDHRDVLSRQISGFFASHCGQVRGCVSRCQSFTSSAMLSEGKKIAICMNKESVRVMLNIVQYLRQQERPKQGRKESTPWDKNFWLDLDYLQVAVAAQYCSAHFSTLLYAEIWFDVQREGTQSGHGSQSQSQSSSQSLSQETRIDALSEASSSQSGVCVQDLLLEAYTWIGDPDGVYGCGAGRKADASSRICSYQHENQWDKAVMTCDIQMSQSAQSSQYDMLHVLQRFGTSHVLSTYLQGMLGEEVRSSVRELQTSNLSSSVRELQFEAAWRVGQWSFEMPGRQGVMQGYHEKMFRALRSVNEDHFSLADNMLTDARLSAISCLWDGCLDSTKGLYSVLADLQCVQIVQNVAGVLAMNANPPSVKLINDSVYTDTDFSFTDPVLHMQCSAVSLMVEKSQREALVGEYAASLRQLAVAARNAGRHQIAERAIGKLKQLNMSDLSLNVPIKLEESRLYWARGEQDIAKHLIKSTIETLKKLRTTYTTAARLYPEALSIYGNWLAETRSENPNIIMEQYMEKTISLFEERGEAEGASVDAYLSLARYADTQYQNIVNYMRSSTFEAKQTLMKESKAEAERLREVMGEMAKDRYLNTLEKQSNIDEHELESKNQDRNIFLAKAVENYIKCLRSGDEHNLRVFRLTSLWFNNLDNELVNQMIQGCIEGIKSYKWLPLMYQLAARMDMKARKDTSVQFLNTLNKLIYDTCVTHPYHTLFCVLALANANRDTELLQQGRATKKGKLSKSQPETCIEEGRVSAAKALVERLRKDKKVGGVVKDMETLCEAYIQLANWNVSQYAKCTTAIALPDALWIAKVKDLKNVPIPTKEIKVEPSGEYRDIPYILQFDGHFKLAGGINLPKIITCLGSDGSRSRQLVKGRDDLRQDAVMQQVFGMVNSLLQKDAETRKRQLQIRKYKVIPLSQRSGLLEWCEGTQPIGEYLIGSATSGSQGAHARYRPQDWQHMDCRKHMATASTTEGKLTAYLQICAKFQPVFRHFFLENFPDPPVWFQRRLAYTRSVATNSIVGYILGLGDRHPQNILIDKNTAELVHIDLGVAFEQGEILPTPETVPFRLTRDIEDAMGASGVEGVFRRCCEKTMDVMRNNQEALLTILEVLLYDPLHAWTISPAKAYELQRRRGDSNDTMDVANITAADLMDYAEKSGEKTNSATQESVNKLAERVLLRLQQKLQGQEDGVQLSLSGQVNHLIQEARNTHNLSRLFSGWQPFI